MLRDNILVLSLCMKNITLIFVFILAHTMVFAQEPAGLIVKTNVLNLVMKRPALSIEKTFSDKYGLELSYTSGEIKNIGHLDYYHYEGFLLRAKKYIKPIRKKEANAFYGAYFGNLDRKIITHSSIDRTGFFSWGRNRDFEASSLRYGGTFGVSFIPNKHFLIEGLAALGYGNYYNVKSNLWNKPPSGYFDFQFWFSVGYSF